MRSIHTLGTIGDAAPILATLFPKAQIAPAKKKHVTINFVKHTHVCIAAAGNHRWTVFTPIPQCPHKQKDGRVCPVNVQCPSHPQGEALVGEARQI